MPPAYRGCTHHHKRQPHFTNTLKPMKMLKHHKHNIKLSKLLHLVLQTKVNPLWCRVDIKKTG